MGIEWVLVVGGLDVRYKEVDCIYLYVFMCEIVSEDFRLE